MANIIRYFPTQALNFSFKDTLHKIFDNQKKDNYSILRKNILAGGFAGCFSTIFVYPLDFARTRIGVDIGKMK